MSGGVNSVNCFLSEMEDSKIKDMCTYIANYYNNSDCVDYQKLAYTLNHLKRELIYALILAPLAV